MTNQLHAVTRTRHGFTLLEIAVTVALIGILITLSIVVSMNAIGRTNLRSAADILMQSVRRAQTLSQNNVNGNQWGVYVCPGDPVPAACSGTNAGIVLYERTEFDTYDSDDLVFEINPQIAVSGALYDKMISGGTPKGLTFARFSGDPVEATYSGAIIFTMNDESRAVTVNSRGVVER